MKLKGSSVFVLPLIALAVLVGAFLPLRVSAAGQPGNVLKQHKIHLLKNLGNANANTSNNLIYNGGPVMGGTTQVYAIFWEPTGSYVSSSYNSLILRYFRDVGGSGLYHNNTQYKDSGNNYPSNAALAASWVDTAPYPLPVLQDSDIQNEVTHAINVNGWTPAITHVFFVFTAKNEVICSGGLCSFTYFCAYHSYFGANTIYAAMPYTGTSQNTCGTSSSPNGDHDADSTINVTSHEQMEAATDPLLNAWIDSSGQEIGDKCAWNFGSVGGNGANVTWNGDPYIVQQEWDNTQSGCVLSGP
ncbi:MAG: hypothetical protein JO112_14625 [Planctomycetes bacterium]|nr:hypothetical protein [Planctomycetota bacterium]